jgi:hypothetical protein
MSLEDKVEKLEKVTGLFDEFVENLVAVKTDMGLQSQYAEGYAACLADILSALAEGRNSGAIGAIKMKIEMDSKRETLDELFEGLSTLRGAYKDLLSKD